VERIRQLLVMEVVDWGCIDFSEAWHRQREIADAILVANHPDTLVLCEHFPVITRGRLTQQSAVLESIEQLEGRGVSVLNIDRGGEATVHNPGQLVGYPIVHLERHRTDLHWFLRAIEQCIIDVLHDFEIQAGRVEGKTGVWINGDRKVCAIGIHCRKWVTTHGFALNVCNDLSLFQSIIPCGIRDKGVTSMEQELGRPILVDQVRGHVAASFQRMFMSIS